MRTPYPPHGAPDDDLLADGINALEEYQYRLHLVGYPDELGAQSQIEWRGNRYAIDGDPIRHNGSRRTRHTVDVTTRR